MDEARYLEAPTFAEYLAGVGEHPDLWRGLYERARVPEDLAAEARSVPGSPRLLALSEDWCGDAVNTLPVVARLAEEVGWDLRVLGRDENPDLMDAHLTDGSSRSIPVVIVYDDAFDELGWWGPRPAELQAWMLGEGRSLPSDERYRLARRWYARDRGRTALTELLEVVRERTLPCR